MDWDSYNPTDEKYADKKGAVIENGVYDVVINRAVEKKTKSGTGSYIELEFQILSGPRQNMRLWPRLNIENQNETAQNIGRAQFRDLLLAIGHEGKVKPDGHTFPQLLNKTLKVRVKVKNNGDFGPQSECVKFMPRGENGSVPPQTQQTQEKQPETAGSNAGQPW